MLIGKPGGRRQANVTADSNHRGLRAAVLLLGAALLGACGAPPEPGVAVDGRRIAVIDMHLHTGTSPNPGTRTEPPYADPAYLEESIKAYPGCTFILGHTGYDTYNKALTFIGSAIALA
jgi:hypothetical protein